jgi:chromosome segregation ATPase
MDIDATKAPRTHATWKKAYDAQELAKLMVELSVQLEVELNVATVNEAFAENKAYMLEKELKQAQDRIKERDEWNEGLDGIIDRLTEKIIFLSEIRQEAGVENANLREKLSATNEHINRLEEAGESLYENSGPSRWDSPEVAARKLTDQSNWNKVKEAKP